MIFFTVAFQKIDIPRSQRVTENRIPIERMSSMGKNLSTGIFRTMLMVAGSNQNTLCYGECLLTVFITPLPGLISYPLHGL